MRQQPYLELDPLISKYTKYTRYTESFYTRAQ
jgi:hypothetical protein